MKLEFYSDAYNVDNIPEPQAYLITCNHDIACLAMSVATDIKASLELERPNAVSLINSILARSLATAVSHEKHVLQLLIRVSKCEPNADTLNQAIASFFGLCLVSGNYHLAWQHCLLAERNHNLTLIEDCAIALYQAINQNDKPLSRDIVSWLDSKRSMSYGIQTQSI